MNRLLILTLAFLSFSFANAKEINLLTITSSDDPNIYRIGLMLDKNTNIAHGMYKREFDKKGEKIKDPSMHMEFPIHRLKNGVVVVERSNCSNVVNVKSTHLDPSSKAVIKLNVVKNCLWGSYFTKEIEVVRVSNEGYMISYEGQVITEDQKLHFNVGTLGVKSIDVKRNNYVHLFE